MDLRISGQIIRNVNLEVLYPVYSSTANEAEVESLFEEYLKDIGYGSVGGYFTKRMAKNAADKFPSKTGSGNGYPDYVFYENGTSNKIIAVGDVKAPDSKGGNNSLQGLADCTDIYLKDYNRKHPNSKIRICFGYDGFNFVIKYLDASEKWSDITIDGDVLSSFPTREMLPLIHGYGNVFTTQIQKNIAREALEPYFAQCDTIFRTGKSSLSAIDKAAEISIFIFLKIFSNDGLDSEFIRENGSSVWENIQKGNVSIVNKIFKDFLNKQYENVFPDELIKVDSRMTRELAKTIDTMFDKCKIDRMTDVKGNALEYYQKDSKDKKIGEFFTPRHLIELIIALTKPEIKFQRDDEGQYIVDKAGKRVIQSIEKIYDPACGSGGFLITSFSSYIEKYGKHGVTNEDLQKNVIFGNELKDTTVMLTKLNMILLGDGHNHISNENALGYEKIAQLECDKDENGKFIEVDSKDIEWKGVHVGTEIRSMPFEKGTQSPIIEQFSNKKYYLAHINQKGKLVKKKDSNGKYVELDVDKLVNDDAGNWKVSETGEPVLVTGNKEHKFWRAHIKLQEDGIKELVDYINVKPVNDKVREYHKEYFGKFDIVMANHPYALEEPKKPDELFIRHMIESVRKDGRIACIVGETLLFHRTYASFRGWMLENVTVEAIISLPQGVFNPYTDVKTSILLLSKNKPVKSHKTWLVDVQNDGFDLNLRRAPIQENDLPKVKRLWERWGGYEVEDENGKNIVKSFHKEEIGFAEFHHLDKSNWCVKRYNTPQMSVGTKYDLCPMSTLLKRVKTAVDIEDENMYKQVTVQMHNQGIVLRTEQEGSDIGTKKQFSISKGQFLISKIDARNGAYGIVPEELDGAVITGNFWTYNINTKKVLPKYLTYLMRHDFFIKMCNACSYGATNRWYLDEDTFNNFKIPIPSIPEQKDFLKRIEKHTIKIELAKREIQNQENEIMHIIDEIVGED